MNRAVHVQTLVTNYLNKLNKLISKYGFEPVDTDVVLMYRVWLNDSEFNLNKAALNECLNNRLIKQTPKHTDNINSLLNNINFNSVGLSVLKKIKMNDYGVLLTGSDLHNYCLIIGLSTPLREERILYKYVDNLNQEYILAVKHNVNNQGYIFNDIMMFDVSGIILNTSPETAIREVNSESANPISTTSSVAVPGTRGDMVTTDFKNMVPVDRGGAGLVRPAAAGIASPHMVNIAINFKDISSKKEQELKTTDQVGVSVISSLFPLSAGESSDRKIDSFNRIYDDYKLVFKNGKVEHVELMYNFPNMHVDSLELIRDVNIGALDL